MPPKSKAQAKLMGAAAGDPKVAKRVGIPQSVAREYLRGAKTKKLPARKRKAKR